MAAPTLVLIHGYPFDHTLWDSVIPYLDKQVRWLAPDLPGFGGRPVNNGEPALEHMANDLHAKLERSDSEKVVVAGMSMGGYVALAWAEQYPSSLAGLALVSSQAAGDTDSAKASRRSMIEKVRKDGSQVAAAAAIPNLFGGTRSSDPNFTRFPQSGAEQAGVEGITWALEAMARRPDRTALFQSLTIPTLVIHGTEDKFIPIERARALAESGRDARFVGIPGVGHASPLEAPKPIADALNELVERAYGHK